MQFLMELLESGVELRITIRRADPDKGTHSLTCPHCGFQTRAHPTRAAAERALRSHMNHCPNDPRTSDLMEYLDDVQRGKYARPMQDDSDDGADD